jgi:hypothetical protein
LPRVTHFENRYRVHTKHEFLPPEPFLCFSQRTCPIHYFRSKTHVRFGFTQFRCRTSPIPKIGIGCRQTQFLPPDPFLHFSQRTCPIHYFRSKTHVRGGFAQFRCRTSPIPKTGIGVHTMHEFLQPEPFLCCSQRTCPIHNFRCKTHVWGAFAQFRCRTSPIPKTGIRVHTKHEIMPPEPFLRFSQGTCPIHYFRSKTHVWVGFAKFRCRTSPIPKLGIGCIQTQFLSPEPFLRFSQRTCPIHYFSSKTQVWVGFTQFRCRTSPIPKTGIGCIQTQFLPPKPFLRFSQRTCLIHYFMSKTHVWIVSRNFVAARHPFRKRVPGCIQSTSFWVPDLSARGDNSDLAEVDPCDLTTTSKPEAPMQSLNQLPVVTDLADARSA